ncbi:hypothetical protein V6N11_036235 [Hibiscus sabdariffa]|uniref:C2H2-type domain-containing protein n=1 Tax=Hibiscus sabdariffa TaxID=183260 RepID=A0ABR2R9U3_9ROSI
MDIQNQDKNLSSGGVHLCHKCGWPFPNPHPSAKHRRSHKKICGTIEGYRLFDSRDTTHSAASDEEPLSEEYHKTPFAQVPKVLESFNLEKNIGGIGAISNRSEDEVFSDAATEFQEAGFSLGRQDSLDHASKSDSVADKDLTSTISFKDCEDTCDVIPIETEPVMFMLVESRILGGGDKVAEGSVRQDVSEESRKVGGGDKVAKGSVRQETGTEENDVDNLNKNLAGSLILTGEHAGEISETVSMSETRLAGTSDMVLKDAMVQLEEEVSDMLASKTSINENAEQEIDGNGNTVINLEKSLMNVVESNTEHASVTSEKADDSNTRSTDKIVEDKQNGDKSALNTVVDDLYPKAESAKYIDATMYTLTDAVHVTVSDTSFSSNEVYDKTENETESVYALSVPEDNPVVENAEIKLHGFKDHNTVRLPESDALASEEIIIDKEDEVGDCVSHEKSDTFPLNQLNEDNKADASCTYVAEDKLGGNSAAIVKEKLVGGKADVIQLGKGSDTLGSFVDVDTTENEKVPNICSLEEKQPVYVSDDLYKTNFSGSMISALPNANPTVSHADVEARKLNNVFRSDDMDTPESARTEVIDLAEDNNSRKIDDKNYAKNMLTCDSSLSQTIPAPNLPETRGPHSNRVSNSSDDIKESKISRDNKEQGVSAGEDLMASAIENNGGNELDKTSPDQSNKELIHSLSDPESTAQNSGAVNDGHTLESGVNISGTSTVSLQGETDNSAIKPQLGATIGDVSNPSSQTESLDGQWGSVPVISTWSDNPAVTDTENLPSTGSQLLSEPEKANIKKPTVAPGEQRPDKSDEFEPPSFMTLVEPGGSNQAAAAWFPSLNHAANESQGRKKNEAIIAKVTNGNAKQHSPLKSLLGDASNETKPKSPNSKEPPREEKVAKDNAAMVTKVSSILGPESPDAEPADVETAKEWNSPARYQADIKREKRKVKGRPLWFPKRTRHCCSRCLSSLRPSPPPPPPPDAGSSRTHTTLLVETYHHHRRLRALLEKLEKEGSCPLQILRDDGDWTKNDFWAAIRFLKHASRSNEILQVFHIWKNIEKSRVNELNYEKIIRLFCEERMVETAVAALQEMKDYGLRPSLEIYNSIIHAYADDGKFDDAMFFLNEMKEIGLEPGTDTYDGLIKAYGKYKMYDEISSCLRMMESDGCPPDHFTYNLLIREFSRAGLLQKMERVHRIVISKQMNLQSSSLVAMLEAYANFGIIGKMEKVYRKVVNSTSLKEDTIRKLAEVYIKNYMFSRLDDMGIDLSSRTGRNDLVWSLRLLSHACVLSRKGMDSVIREMDEAEASWNATITNIILLAYLKMKDFKHLRSLLSQLQSHRVRPDITTIGILFDAIESGFDGAETLETWRRMGLLFRAVELNTDPLVLTAFGKGHFLRDCEMIFTSLEPEARDKKRWTYQNLIDLVTKYKAKQ